MPFEASRIASVTPLPVQPAPESASACPAPGRFARLYDLTIERDRRTPPPEVLDQIAEAARVYEELDALGLQVRFGLGTGSSPELRDRDGDMVRPLTAREVVDPSCLLPPDAA